MIETTIFLHGFSGDSSSLDEFVASVGYKNSMAVDLPAFGKNTRTYEASWDGYVDAAMESIKEKAAGPYRIIGHSHGAMVAFGLAERFPDDVKDVVLICPVASGTNLGKAFIRTNNLMRVVLGDHRTLTIHKMQPVVDAVTRVAKRRDWPSEAYERIKSIRRTESTRYSTQMLNVLKLIPSFRRHYEHVKLKMPVSLIFARHDLLVSKADRAWYQLHTMHHDEQWCRGGHVAPVVFPAEVAELVRRSKGSL